MMVGIAVGLFIVAGASVVVTTQLSDNRRLLLETQVQQDLRATADIITRELRRAGYVENAEDHVWRPAGPSGPAGSASSAHAEIRQDDGPSGVEFEYLRAANPGPWGFKLETRSVGGVGRGVIRTRLSTGGWQDLTDVNTLDVTAFTVAPLEPVVDEDDPVRVRETLPCPRACVPDASGDTTWCWPQLMARVYEIEITGQAVSDPSVQRSIRSIARLRNDWIRFNQPNPDPALAANPMENVLCP
jgi:type IV pilus assembly protein PilW